MKLLRRLLYAVAGLVALLLAIGLFLPTSVHVERSVVTSASPATVYAIVSGFGRFNEWSPWFDLDPHTRYTYSGPEHGVGARMAWTSDKPEVGAGSQEIIAVEPGRSVTTQLDFGPQGRATARIEAVPEGSGADYEKGLARLKTLAEAAPAVM